MWAKAAKCGYSNGKNIQRALCTILPDNILSQKVKLKKSRQGAAFKFIEDSEGKLNLFEGETPVLSYNFGMQLPKGVEPDRERSTYVYPIYDLNGTNVLDDFPVDHLHHRGLSWMWPKEIIGGNTFDL